MTRSAVLFADAGPDIGLGHLWRTAAIGRALADNGAAVRLFTPDAAAADLARRLGLDAAVGAHGAALPEADITVFDSYRVAAAETGRRRAAGLVCVLDDLGDRPLDADVIVNPNLYGGDIDYSSARPRRVLAGLAWCPVDPRFVAARRPAGARAERVLIAFGGTDDGRMALAAAEALTRRAACAIDLVASPLRPADPEAARRAADTPGWRLHHGADMAALMAGAGLYVGAAGSTVWEACAAGLDLTVAGLFPNQMGIVEALAAAGFPTVSGFDAEALAAAAAERLAAPLANPLAAALDGAGAARIAGALLEMAPQGAGA